MKQGEIVDNTYYARFIYRETIWIIRDVEGAITICNMARGGAGCGGAITGAGRAAGHVLSGHVPGRRPPGGGGGKRACTVGGKYRYIRQPFQTSYMDLVLYDLVIHDSVILDSAMML